MLHRLEAILAEVAAEEILPRRPSPAQAAEFIEPWRAEVVTAADTAAEAALEHALRSLRDVPVLGEEAAKLDPARLRIVDSDETYWVVDPLDGSSAFAAGREGFGVMVALVRDGESVLACIHLPCRGRSYLAEHGAGTWSSGERLRCDSPRADEAQGTLYTSFFDADTHATAQALAPRHAGSRAQMQYAACLEYTSLVEGDKDFVLYGRLRPWDHVPGTLLVREAGGRTAFIDGRPYSARTKFGPMLAAHDPSTWTRLAESFAPAFAEARSRD